MSDESKGDSKVIKDEKCVSNKRLYSTTIRLSVPLREPDEESCSVFNYISLIAVEKRNRRCEREKIAVNGSVEENPEADEEAKRLAQHFEEKYGNSNTKKKKKKKAPTFYNYTELAAGYDESDSFIDNSEAFDEALPDEMETFHGGYYVNCGQLEFKKVELGDDNSDYEEIRTGKKKNCILKSDDSDSDDENSVKSDVEKMDSVDDEVESTHKKLPEEISPKGAESAKSVNEVSKTNGEKLKVEKSKENVPNNVQLANGELIKKSKKYKKRRLLDDDVADGSSKPKKKAITVKTLLEEKRVVENGDTCSLVGKAGENPRNSINDIIESVVNAARNHSEDSRDSLCSSSDTKSTDSRTSYDTEKDSHHDEMEVTEASGGACGFPNIPKEQIKLPDNLPADVLEVISQIKNSAQNSDLGVRTFFNPYINSKLLSLETKVRPLMSNSRHALYGHLANFLPCSKDTLMKRAKKLLIEEEEKHMVEPFKKLKASIDKIMPSLLNNYAIACQQAEEKNSELTKNGDLDEKKSSSIKLPHKKFIWTEETRSCLRDLVTCRLKCFHMLKPRKESPDDYVKKFLETKVKPLWPTGWMDASILWKESHAGSNPTTKAKKSSTSSQPTSSGTSSSSSTTTTTTSAKKSHSSVPSSNNSTSAATSISAANYNSLLQSIALQYSQSDMGYPITSSSSIPYRPDLSLLTSGSFPVQNANLPLSMDLLSRFALANNQYGSGHHAYAKATSPPKKQSPSPGYSSQRSTTPHSGAFNETTKKSDKVSGDGLKSKYNDTKKSDKLAADLMLSQYNDLMKIDAKHSESKKSSKLAAASDKLTTELILSQYNDMIKDATKHNESKKSDKLATASDKLTTELILAQYNDIMKIDATKHSESKKSNKLATASDKLTSDLILSQYNDMMKDAAKRSESKKSDKQATDLVLSKYNDMMKIDTGKHSESKKSDKMSNEAIISKFNDLMKMDAKNNEAKKSDKMSNEALISKYNDMMKIDAKYNDMMKIDSQLNASNKNKKEHHMLNHISQYNKHYSHKTEKRRSIGNERKEKSTPSTPNNVASAPPSTKASPCEVLDLSPTKVTKTDAKADTVVYHSTPEPKHINETNSSISISSTAAKDHSYWSSAANSKKDSVPEIREEAKRDKVSVERTTISPLIQHSINTAETTITPVAQSATSKPTHISRKQRILQESAKSAAQEVIKSSENRKPNSHDGSRSVTKSFHESTYSNESQFNSSNTKHSKEEEKLPSIKEEKRPVLEEKQMIEETATATDILSKIINDTLQDNSTPLLPQFTNPLFENNRIKQEVKIEDVEIPSNEYLEKSSHPPSRESHTPLLDKSSPCSVNSERKTPSSDRAEMEAAEVIKDLLVLNQIGGNNQSRMDNYIRFNADMNFSNGSMLSQSSPHNSNNSKRFPIPRVTVTGFQDEFLQHIFKTDRDSSSYSSSSNAIQENCISSDFPSLKNNKSSFNHVSASSSVKPGNTSLFNYQSVIMPPSSVKWHIPESKS